MTVKTTLARGCLFVDLGIKLVHCKLAVGIASKKLRSASLPAVLYLFFLICFLLKLRTVLKLYHKKKDLSSLFLF
jgi:hypothetical protein